MEALYALLMFLAFISDDEGIKDRMTHPCDKPYVCKGKKTEKECLKEAINFQMENCLSK